MKFIAGASLMLAGCALFAPGSTFPSDLQKVEDCVAAEAIANGVTDVGAIIAACGPGAVETVIDAIKILIDGGKVSPAQAAKLRTSMATHGVR
jgi:hypothetical protein